MRHTIKCIGPTCNTAKDSKWFTVKESITKEMHYRSHSIIHYYKQTQDTTNYQYTKKTKHLQLQIQLKKN